VVLCQQYIVLLSLCGALLATDCPFVPMWFFVGHRLSFCPCVVLCLPYIVLKRTIYGRQSTTQGQKNNIWQTKNHIGTKGQYMADKAPHRDKRTIYGRQSTTQGQKDNIWPTKHHTGTKEQSMADKEPRGALSAIDCPFVPVWCFVGHRFSFCPYVVLCLP
jgi:hypothetical protein